MNRVRLALMLFCVFLASVICAADAGVGPRYWGWLRQVPMGDKIGHCSLMFTFCLLANLALRCRSVRVGSMAFLIGTAVVAVLVTGEEFSQIWIPGRDFDLLDLSADAVGILCGDLMARKLQPRLRAKVPEGKAAVPEGAKLERPAAG